MTLVLVTDFKESQNLETRKTNQAFDLNKEDKELK